MQTLITKLSGAITAVLCLQLLNYYGYVKQSPAQSAGALHGIWVIMNIVPIFGFALMGIIIAFFYKLKESDVAHMMQEKVKLTHTVE